MRKSIYVMSFVFFLLIVTSNNVWSIPIMNGEESIKVKETHPLVLSPEKTLRIYLEAFINRDIDTVMAYFIDLESVKIKEWRERMRAITLQYMTDRKHVKSIIDIKFIKFKDLRKGKEAYFEATIETTPRFSNSVKKDDKGRYTVTHTWIFWQMKENGPWYFNGGGL